MSQIKTIDGVVTHLALADPARPCCGAPMPPKSPPLRERLANLAKAAVAFTKSGFALTERELRISREDVCQGRKGYPVCPAYDDGVCRECGCLISLKSRSAVETCPRDMWPLVDPTELANSIELTNPSFDVNTICVVIPTHAVELDLVYRTVRECCVERVHVVVVDDRGDYARLLEETVLTPGADLPWTTSVNYGIRYGLEEAIPQPLDRPLLRKFRFFVPLLAGTRLSVHYFRNLLWAYRETGAAVVAPFIGEEPAANYKPRWVVQEQTAATINGALISRDAIVKHGLLDEQLQHPSYVGTDYHLRVAGKQEQVLATAASFLNDPPLPDYNDAAAASDVAALARKPGQA